MTSSKKEIYNFQEIKQQLRADGYSFKSNTDTEVILNAYDGKNKSSGGSDMFGADSNDRDKAKKTAWEDYESKWFNMGDQQGNKEWKRLKLEEWKLMRQQKKGGLDKNISFIAS